MKGNAAKVLIIDDSLLIGVRLKEMFQDNRNLIIGTQAINIEQGRDMLDSENPDIIILDIGFPNQSAMFLIPEIKKNNKSALVIMFTNYSHDLYRTKCAEMGADCFFDKSTESELLKDYLDHYPYGKLST